MYRVFILTIIKMCNVTLPLCLFLFGPSGIALFRSVIRPPYCLFYVLITITISAHIGLLTCVLICNIKQRICHLLRPPVELELH